MHEASIADGLLSTVISECRKGGFSRVETVWVKIGRASGVMPEALVFAFDALKAGTIAADACLEIESVPVSGHCHDCDTSFTVDEIYVLCCPSCNGNSFTLNSGRELNITELEVF